MNFFQNMFFEKIHVFYLKWPLWPSISQKIFGGIAFSDPQQFSELENFGPLGAEGGVHGEVSWPIDYMEHYLEGSFTVICRAHLLS